MTICGTATPWAKIALVLVCIALGLQVAGFATNYWQQSETIQENIVYSVGLWNAYNCSGGHDSPCDVQSIPDSYQTGSFKAVQAFEIIVLIVLTIIVIVLAFYVASERFREMSVAVFVTIFCFLIVTLGLIALIIWLAQIPADHYPGFSCGLCAFAFILVFLAGVLMIPDIRRYNQRGKPDVQKVVPTPRSDPRYPSKYDQITRGDRSYNRKFAVTPETNVRHYYNPNRDPYIRSPPPKYKTNAFSQDTMARSIRTEIQTPDVYLGRDTKRPRRY